jgi:hypothetical protein
LETTRRRDYKPWNQKLGYPQQQRADRATTGIGELPAPNAKPIDKKLADLKAFRRAQGLCDHCGEKWSRDHKCAPQVGLHVLDELYALFSKNCTIDGPTPAIEEELPEANCCCLSTDVAAGARVKTLQFAG